MYQKLKNERTTSAKVHTTDKKMSKIAYNSELTLSEQKEDCNKEETYYTLT